MTKRDGETKQKKFIIQQSSRTSVYLLSMGAKEEKSEKAFDDLVALVWCLQQQHDTNNGVWRCAVYIYNVVVYVS